MSTFAEIRAQVLALLQQRVGWPIGGMVGIRGKTGHNVIIPPSQRAVAAVRGLDAWPYPESTAQTS